ncbi:MAG: hypothetical protein ABSG36_06835 [Acidimicrobiales bacterium]
MSSPPTTVETIGTALAFPNSIGRVVACSAWGEFLHLCPDLAAAGKALLYERGLMGLRFLATVRQDGGPRPDLSTCDERRFIIPSPKRDDLRRDSRFALHRETFPPTRHDKAFYATGRAVFMSDPEFRDALTGQVRFELDIDKPGLVSKLRTLSSPSSIAAS